MSRFGPMMPSEIVVSTFLGVWLRHRVRLMYDYQTLFTECGDYIRRPWEQDKRGAEIQPCPECFPEDEG